MRYGAVRFFNRRGLAAMELMVALVLVFFVSVLAMRLVNKSAGSFQRAKLQSNTDREHFLALQKVRQTGELKSQLQSAMGADYARFVQCLESTGTGCLSFHDRVVNFTDSKNVYNSTLDMQLTECLDPANCNKVLTRSSSAVLECESNTKCTGLRLAIQSETENGATRKLAQVAPMAHRSFEIQIPSTELVSSGLKGVCDEGLVSGINKATNQVECSPASATTPLTNFDNSCAESFDGSSIWTGIKETGLIASGCQRITLASWKDASGYPSPVQKPPLDLEVPVSKDVSQEEVQVVGDIYLIMDTSGSMDPILARVAEGLNQVIQTARSKPTNSINLYAFPISSMDNELISNQAKIVQSPLPNSTLNAYRVSYPMKDPFITINSGDAYSYDLLKAKINGAPRPATSGSGDAVESGICAMSRLLSSEYDKQTASGTISNRRKFFLLVTDEKDELDKQGRLLKFVSNSNCTYDSEMLLSPTVHPASEQKMAGWINTIETSAVATTPTNTEQKVFKAYGLVAYLDYNYKTVSDDLINASNPNGVKVHNIYTPAIYIIPSEYGLENSTFGTKDCPASLKSDLSKFMGPQLLSMRNAYNYYTSSERKAEPLEVTGCHYYGGSFGDFAFFDFDPERQTKSEFLNFNFFNMAGITRDGQSYADMADYLAKYADGRALQQLRNSSATKAIMQNSNESSNYTHYWNRQKVVPVNEAGGPKLSDYYLNTGKLVDNNYFYIAKQKEWLSWDTVPNSSVWTSQMQNFVNKAHVTEVTNIVHSEMPVAELLRKAFDLVYKSDYSLAAIIPQASSSCIPSGRVSPLYTDLIAALPAQRSKSLDLCSDASDYADVFKSVLDFFSFKSKNNVKTYQFDVELKDPNLASKLEEYLASNDAAEFAVTLISEGLPPAVLQQGLDFSAALNKQGDRYFVHLEFVQNDKNYDYLIHYEKLRVSLK